MKKYLFALCAVAIAFSAISCDPKTPKTFEVPIQLQWGPDLVAFRPYGFVEPFIGYQVSANGKGEAKSFNDQLQKTEYGMSLGAGLDIWKIQVSAKYFWNFGSVYKSDISKTGSTIGGILDGNNFNGFAISAAIFF